MDNPIKGEVSFEAEGKAWTLVFDNNAWCALEAHLDRGILDIYQEIGSWSPPMDDKGEPLPETPQQANVRAKRIRMGFCRALFWAGLTARHRGMTIERAGTLMTSAGGLLGVMNLIAKGVSLAQSGTDEGQQTKAAARPPKGARRRRGTGSAS